MREKLFGLVLLLFGALCAAVHEEYFQANICRSAAPQKTPLRTPICWQNQAQDTIDFLKNGEQYLKSDDQYRDLTFMIGNTGTGKSTLVRYVTGDLADLKSVKVGRSGFVIQYKDDGVIGNSTTVSQTIYPSLVIDQANIAFYDCPDFDDTRNTSVEIAATYYIKKVIDHAQSLKFVLVVNYIDVLSGESRDNFPDLVRHLFSLIKNVTNYRDSISLVATKAPVESDENLIANIADFLQEYRYEQLKTMETNKFAQYTVELLNILLTSKDNGKTFDKIGVFKKPTKAGPLNEIPEMVEGKQNIREMILNRTTYSKKIDEDFGYTISDTSILKLVDIAKEINDGITNSVKNIGNETRKSFENESNQLGNLIALTNRFQLAHDQLLSITKLATNRSSELLIDRFINATNSLGVAISQEYLTEISIRSNYIRFLQNFTTEQLAVNTDAWLNGLDDCIEYLENNKNWYKFLGDIYSAFSDYDFRRDLSKYNVFDLDDWGVAGKRQGIYIDRDNFAKFVNKQSIPSTVRDLKPTQFQLETLNNLLNITLKQQPTVSCEADGTKMVIKGDYVRTSDVNLTVCGDKLNELQLFALHTVYIDSDFNITDRRFDIVIIATNWIIWGDRKIIMKGSNAENRTSERARAGGVSSEKATPGMPGLPGGPPGNFIGLGASFINSNKFSVNLIGGDGGRGQDGGLCFIATEADVKGITTNAATSSDDLDDKNYRKIEYLPEINPFPFGLRPMHGPWPGKQLYIYSDCNGYGGDGGRGGIGGLPGHAKIFELNEKSLVNFVLENGTEGQGGHGAPTSTTDLKKIKMQYFNLFDKLGYWTELSRDADDSCPIEQSVDGGNAKDITQPTKPTSYDPSFAINDFGAFVRENQVNPLKRDDLAQIIKLIANNSDILQHYSTKGFVNELQLLEDQFYRLQNDVDFKVYYRSISERIERFVGNLNASQIQLPREQLKVFNYLYTSAWGKCVMLTTKESNMIIDIESYLDLTVETIGKVERSARVKIIDDNRKSYRQDIDAKMNEASSFIDSEILPKIASISGSFDRNLDALVNETIEKRKNAEKQRDEYTEQQKKLQTQFGLHILFGSLKLIGQVASMMGPYGMAASGVINGAVQIADGFIEDPAIKGVPSIPGGVKETLDSFQEAYKKNNGEKAKALEEQLDNMKNLAIKHPKELTDLGNKIEELKKRLKDEMGKDLEKYIEISEELESTITKQKNKIPKDETEMLESFKHAENAVKVVSSVFDIYTQFKADENKMDEVGQAMEKNQENINELKKYETEVYSKLRPMIDQMRANIADMERGLPGKSSAVLAIKQWNIQSLLRDTKFELARLTKGFNAQDDLLQTFLKLSEAFNTLITIYDRIDSYADQEKLGDYIATVASSDMNSIQVSDPELQSALDRLDLIITSNVLLNEYKSATDGFKHTVFPFITSYLDHYRLPANLQLGNDTADLVTIATTQIKNLHRKIAEYNRTVINGNDQYIFSTTFDTINPFFKWHFVDYRQTISDLFSGKRVSLWADIKRAPQVNAIKFNVVELLFRAPDAAQQKQVDDLLANVDITLTHMGNSHYRCGAEFYTINSPSQTITYSFRKNNGGPVTRNIVYDKLMGGNLMLSPYAMWTIQLKSLSMDKSLFVKLGQLADRVDLTLIGHGQYVDIAAPVCGNSLKGYYQIDL